MLLERRPVAFQLQLAHQLVDYADQITFSGAHWISWGGRTAVGTASDIPTMGSRSMVHIELTDLRRCGGNGRWEYFAARLKFPRALRFSDQLPITECVSHIDAGGHAPV